MISEKEYQERMAAAEGKPKITVTPIPRLNEMQILKARNVELAIKVEQLEYENACLVESLREIEARAALSGVHTSFWDDEGDDEEWKK